ncbi:MAG TPA: hypothetical protein QF761_15865 [Pirellulales bacterium]|jgi:hypothetical protein|nr:hypothetical protein [Pirellulales bacterium]
MPVLVPWFMLIALASNIILVVTHTGVKELFGFLLFIQGCFYLLAVLGLMADRFKWYIALTAIPFYFMTVNVGSLCGFLPTFLAHRQLHGARWNRSFWLFIIFTR